MLNKALKCICASNNGTKSFLYYFLIIATKCLVFSWSDGHVIVPNIQ